MRYESSTDILGAVHETEIVWKWGLGQTRVRTDEGTNYGFKRAFILESGRALEIHTPNDWEREIRFGEGSNSLSVHVSR